MYLKDHLKIQANIKFIRTILDDIPADLYATGYPRPQMPLRDLIQHNLNWIDKLLSGDGE